MTPRSSSVSGSASAATSSYQHGAKRSRFRFKAPHRTPKPFAKSHRSSPEQEFEPELQSSEQEQEDLRHNDGSTSADTQTGTKAQADAEETPFAESLFDALANADNAAYWAGVYGQPIHIYPRPTVSVPTSSFTNKNGTPPASPSFRPMTDAEYVLYVQRRLWEKTRAGMEESARERARERAKRERMQDREQEHAERKRHAAKVKAARRAEAEDDELWRARVDKYTALWRAGNEIPWPVPIPVSASTSIPINDIHESDIEIFFTRLAHIQGLSLAAVLKTERVRWHPDKIMQRFGSDTGNTSSENTQEMQKEMARHRMQRVTEVWRAVDGIWRRIKEAED